MFDEPEGQFVVLTSPRAPKLTVETVKAFLPTFRGNHPRIAFDPKQFEDELSAHVGATLTVMRSFSPVTYTISWAGTSHWVGSISEGGSIPS